MSTCENCDALEKELWQAIRQRDEAREAAGKAANLMMKGEALRDRMMFESFVGAGLGNPSLEPTLEKKLIYALELLWGCRGMASDRPAKVDQAVLSALAAAGVENVS